MSLNLKSVVLNILSVVFIIFLLFGLIQFILFPEVITDKKEILGYVMSFENDNGNRVQTTIYTDDGCLYEFEASKLDNNTDEYSLLKDLHEGDYVKAIIVKVSESRYFYNYERGFNDSYISAIGVYNYPEQRFPEFYKKMSVINR